MSQVYYLDASRTLYNCTDSAQCYKTDVSDIDSLFAPKRPAAIINETDSRALSAYLSGVRHKSDQRLSQLAQTDSDIVIPATPYALTSFEAVNIVSGRYISAAKNQWLDIELEVSFQGSGTVQTEHKLFVIDEEIGNVAASIKLPVLENGDRLLLKYRYSPDRDLKLVQPTLIARSRDVDGELHLEKFSVVRSSGAQHGETFEVLKNVLQ